VIQRYNISILFFLAVATLLMGCSDDDMDLEPTSFLSELRPVYFERLNFNSRSQVLQLPYYLEEFTNTFAHFEGEYNNGTFSSPVDLENMKLVSMYYSLLLSATTRAYLDDLITFEEIIGTRTTNFFSGHSPNVLDFENKELNAMMERSKEVALIGMNIDTNGDDRLYGCLLASEQIAKRLNNAEGKNDPTVQMEMINYVGATINDYSLFPLWNVVTSQIYFDNYNDPLNTFNNPAMTIVYNNVTSRLNPSFLPTTNESFNSLLAPLYHFDIVLKRADWLIQNLGTPTPQDIQEISEYIQRMEQVGASIQNEQGTLLNIWEYKNTVDERFDKLEEIKTYRNQLSNGNNAPKPLLAPMINSKDFKQGYQCYSCHKPTNL